MKRKSCDLPEQKQLQLRDLTEKRRACRECNQSGNRKNIRFYNPGGDPEMDCDTIGQWTMWNGNLNADYMVVGQDWGTKSYLQRFRENQKKENYPCEMDSITNKNLAECIRQINPDWDILSLEGIQDNARYPLYFTNEILCYKDEKLMNANIPASCYTKCAAKYLLEQIAIVAPKAVILLGAATFHGFLMAAKGRGLEGNGKISSRFIDLIPMVLEEKIRIYYRTEQGSQVRVFPMWHPGGLGLRNAKAADTKKYGPRDLSALDILAGQWKRLGEITK